MISFVHSHPLRGSFSTNCTKSTVHWILPALTAAVLLAFPLSAQADVVLNALVASNGVTLADSDGDYHELIELYNKGTEPVALEGYGLSNDSDEPFQWVFPSVNLEPEEFLVVFATGKDRPEDPEELHTNFRLSASGDEVLLTHPDGSTLDNVPPTEIPRDVAYARQPDGSDNWYFFDEPNMGEPNTGEGYHLRLEPVAFSHEGGFYTEPFELELQTEHEDATIYYTLDGSEPTRSSYMYDGPIGIASREGDPNHFSTIETGDWRWAKPDDEVQKATVIRALAHDGDTGYSDTATRTFFVDPHGSARYGFPVISLVTEPANLFDEEIGIYVPGNHREVFPDAPWRNIGNYRMSGPEWERPVHVEFFEEDGSLGFAQDAGVRIHGNSSTTRPQKSLRLYARGGYGESHFDYPVFGNKGTNYQSFKRLILRNSGNDQHLTMFRDAMIQRLVGDGCVDTQAYRPSIVFINGEYWGIHNIRERYDKYYLKRTHGVDSDNVDMLDYNARVNEGSPDHYEDMILYLQENDIRKDQHYTHIETRLDVDNFIDYNILHIFSRNSDWPHNDNDHWRARFDYDPSVLGHGDGRWRWLIVDMDAGFGYLGGWEAHEHDTLAWAVRDGHWSTFLLRTLLENDDFRHRFIGRFSSFLNTAFAPERILNQIEEFRDSLEPEMLEHIERWGTLDSLWQWDRRIEVMRHFARERPEKVWEHLANHFGVDTQVQLQINRSSPFGGDIVVNGVSLRRFEEGFAKQWVGQYFANIPLKVEVVPDLGYKFDGWAGEIGNESDEASSTVVIVTPEEDITLEPRFVLDWAEIDLLPHVLSEGPYVFSAWPSDSEPGTHPPHMEFRRSVVEDPELDRDPELDVPMEEPWMHPYNLDNRSRIVGLGEDGFAFINTTWFQGYRHDEEWDEDHQGYVGAAVLALDTTGQEHVNITWTGGTVLPNDRTYAIRLQYRVGPGPFKDVLDGGAPVEYTRNEMEGDAEMLGPVALPEEALDEPYVQVRWKYHYIDTGVTGPRAKLRVGDIVVTGDEGTAQTLSFEGLHPAGQADRALIPFDVEARRANGDRAIDYDGPITVHVAEGPGDLDGTLSVEAVNGVARFDGLAVDTPGVYRLEASAPGLSPVVSEAIQVAGLEEVLVPRYMQADPPWPNEDRVPYAFRLRITGLNPHAVYRYANRVATVDEPPTQDGAGNNIFVFPDEFRRNTDTPALGDDPATFSSFETDGDGTFEGWFITEPTGNDRFEDEELHLRILLNDGAGAGENHFFLTTPSTVELRGFGEGADEATGVYAESPFAPRNFVFLYDNEDGEGRPIAGTFVEPGGLDMDERYTAFYKDEVWDMTGRWGALLPNDLEEGVRRIEERGVIDGSIVDGHISADGLWAGLDTREPAGGAAAPLVLDLAQGAFPGLPGWLEVHLEPQEAIAAGAQWRVGDGEWLNSGERVQLPPDGHAVAFRGVDEWVAPETREEAVLPNETTFVSAEYRRVTYTLEYGAEGQGSIVGETMQTVEHGAEGAEVAAVPAEGYRFVEWSDGVQSAQRTDANVTAPLAVTAVFALKEYALTYAAAENGSIDGAAEQIVEHGADGGEIVAVPAEGYRFVEWSDGVESARRTDTDVTADLKVTARFEIATGAIRVHLHPQGALDANAQWSIDGVEWRDSGDTLEDLEPGEYEVRFRSLDDWITPDPKTVDVEAGETAEVTAAYLDFGIVEAGPLLGLSLGGDVLEVEAVGVTADTKVYIGEEPAFLLEDESDPGAGRLVAETPSQWPGEYAVRIENPYTAQEYAHDAPFVYTEDPFEPGADHSPGVIRRIQDTPAGVSTAAGAFPEEDGALRDLDYETEEGIRIHVPVEALPPGTDGAFLTVRSAEKLANLHAMELALPGGATPRGPAADMHVLVHVDGESYELEETFDAPARLAFPAPGDPLNVLFLGGMDTNLDERFEPLLPDEPALTDYEAPLALIDGDEYVEAEITSFTTYALLGELLPGDVNNDGVVNAQDIQIVINAVLGLPLPDGVTGDDTDVTGSGVTNAQDIQFVINTVLGIS